MSQHLTDALALRSARVLCGIAAVLFPIFGVLDVQSGSSEDVRLRAPIWLAIVGVLVGSYVSAAIRRRLRAWLMALVYVITAYDAYLLYINSLHPLRILGPLLVLMGFIATGSYTLTKNRQLATYLVFANLCVLVACWLVKHPLTPPVLVALTHLTLTVFGYVAASNQLTTLRRLVSSQQNLERDIERREQVEAALRHSEARAQSLLEAIPDVLLRVGHDRKVLEVSNHRGHTLGPALNAVRGQPLEQIADSAHKLQVENALTRAFSDEEVTSTSCDVRGSAGSTHAELRAVATGPDEALVVVRDVTKERAFEERLRTSDRLVALGTLATGLAHEINNPLSYVGGNINYAIDELEKRNGATSDVHAAITALVEAREGAERIANIVAGLKQFSDSEQDTLCPTDVNETVRSALRMMKAQLSFNTALEIHFGDVSRVKANPTRLLQVTLNLLANALQALPDRPKDQNLIRIRTLLTPVGIALQIEDNGVGIAPAQLNRIFDPFYTTKAASLATGLGLYLCQRFVSSFGGTISVHSQQGVGTSFRVVLQAAADVAVTAEPASTDAIDAMRVLIVDDEPLVARSVARMLKDCVSTIASSGAEALALCTEHEFDMILCDMMMPGMNGSEFFDALRAEQPDVAGRVVFMSGGAFTDETTRFLANHHNRWLQKPVRREWLLDAAQQLRRESVRLRRAYLAALAPRTG